MDNFRAAEAWLNRAEAYACPGKDRGSQADIRALMENRYSTLEGVTIPSEQQALIRFIRDERFKEFCFEEHFRWFDLRRMEEDERPEIVHICSDVDESDKKVGKNTYRLLKNDPNIRCLYRNRKKRIILLFMIMNDSIKCRNKSLDFRSITVKTKEI